MYRKFTKTKTIADKSGAMEFRNHSKNEASLKSQRGKRSILFGCMLLLLFCGFGNKASAQTGNWTDVGNYDVSWYNASETEFYISTAEQLAGVAYLANNSYVSFFGKTIYMLNDIDLALHYWVSINNFGGTFNGNHHTISNLNIKSTYFYDLNLYEGFFGQANGVLKNINVADSEILVQSNMVTNKEGRVYVGMIVGYSTGVVSSCRNEGKITVSYVTYPYSTYSGGIVGYNDGTIINCSNGGNIEKYQGYVDMGGICGLNSDGVILNCNNFGSINGSGTLMSIGGICGEDEGSIGYGYGEISNCYNKGKVYGSTSGNFPQVTIGGILGFTSFGSKISYCYNLGNVSGSGSASTGSIRGGGNANYTMTNCGTATTAKLNSGNPYPCWVNDVEPYVNDGNPYTVTVDVEATEKNETSIALMGELLNDISISSKGFEYRKKETNYTDVNILSDSFNTILDNLDSNTKYYFWAYVITSNNEKVYSRVDSVNTVSFFAGYSATNMTQLTATLQGNLSNDSVSFEERGFEYKENTASASYNTVVCNDVSIYEVKINNLKPNTSYVYRAYITIDGKKHYGNEVSFTTLKVATSISVSDIMQTSAVLNGSCSFGDASFVAKGIQYGTSTSSYTTVSDTLNYRITELAPNTTYYYRSFITTTEGGTVYSDWKNFTTKSIALTVQQADAISNTSATIHSDIDCDTYSSAEFGFEWRKFDAPDLVPSNTVVAEQYDGKLSFSLRSLVPSTYYKYRGYCKYQNQTYYSDWAAFGTADVFVLYTPDVVTIATTDVENNCIVLHSYVLSGSEDILQQGFEYWIEDVLRSSAEDTNIILTSGTNNTVTLPYADLLPNTTYKFRAFAKTASGTTYGETYSLQTPDFENNSIKSTQETSQIQIYPNPVKEMLYIAGTSGIHSNGSVEIFNLAGKKIVDAQLLNGESVNVSHLSSGVYILKMGNYTRKFVKE